MITEVDKFLPKCIQSVVQNLVKVSLRETETERVSKLFKSMVIVYKIVMS